MPGRPCAAQVLVRRVDDRLGVREVVERRDRAVADPDPLVEHLDHRRQAVRRARGRGDDVVRVGVVAVVVDADDDVQRRAVLDGGGDDDLARRRARGTGPASARSGTCRSTRARRRRRGAPSRRRRARAASDQPSVVPSIDQRRRRRRRCRRASGRAPSRTRAGGRRCRGPPLTSFTCTNSSVVTAPAGAEREAPHPAEAVDADAQRPAHAATSGLAHRDQRGEVVERAPRRTE